MTPYELGFGLAKRAVAPAGAPAPAGGTIGPPWQVAMNLAKQKAERYGAQQQQMAAQTQQLNAQAQPTAAPKQQAVQGQAAAAPPGIAQPLGMTQ